MEDSNQVADQGLTVDPGEIEQHMKDQMDDGQKKDLDKVLSAGNKLLFSKGTHDKLLGDIGKGGLPLAEELGKGGAGIVGVLMKKSGGTLPGETIVPAGIILLARAAEFLSKKGGVDINDQVFEEATKIYTGIVTGETGPDSEGQPEDPGAQDMQGSVAQPPGGLLNTNNPNNFMTQLG